MKGQKEKTAAGAGAATTTNLTMVLPNDLSSYSKPNDVIVKHLDWKITSIDFETQILYGEATYTIEISRCRTDNVATGTTQMGTCSTAKATTTAARTLDLDTANLEILEVKAGTTPLHFTLHPLVDEETKSHLGRHLEINLPTATTNSNQTATQHQEEKQQQITIVYHTTKKCSALQWLPPSQTAGQEHPYLFTQCQAIHARSLLPCQDRCGVKFTYTAQITVDFWATAVMSALLVSTTSSTDTDKQETATKTKTRTKTFCFDQPVPIPSYLLAVAVGDIVKRTISERCCVWSEASVVEAVAYEFQETEDFLRTAETLAGTPYQWTRYDLLCLPPSFPYGGMENPCITFVTPTLLAGDRSLANVIAHEIAHSWTGNLVTNATWDHFWLNEGWTKWFERKIMARMKHNPKFLDFDAIDGRKALDDAVTKYMDDDTPHYTRLVIDNGDGDPDDAFSRVPYEKGFTFLLYLERMVIGNTNAFEKFFQAYIQKFASKTVTSIEFQCYFLSYFWDDTKYPKVADIDWSEWFVGEGMPPVLPDLDQTLAKNSTDLAQIWYEYDRSLGVIENYNPTRNAIQGWSSGQITCFLDEVLQLKANSNRKGMNRKTLTAMNEQYKFMESKNSEILFRYCQLAILAEDERILPVLVRFITTQGRMKYVRPLYQQLYASTIGKQLAIDTFLQHQKFYHPIATKMIASDLKGDISKEKTTKLSPTWFGIGATVAAVVAGITMALLRSNSSRRK